MSRLPRVAVIFHRFGPYHVARLAAAGGRGPVTGIEISAQTGEYAWDSVPGLDCFHRVTLADDASVLSGRAFSHRLAQALDDRKPQVVFAHGWVGLGLSSVFRWCWRTGVPVVVMSESSANDGPRRAWKEAIKRRIVRCFSAALVGGTRHMEYAVRLGIPSNRVFRGYDAVDNAYFAAGADAARAGAEEIRCRLGLPTKYFLASSRFVPKKNLVGLLAAYAEYRSTAAHEPWEMVILGDGPLRSEVERSREAHGLTNCVHLPGFKQYPDLPAYYGLAKAFVHASTTEQWGLVVNEAMAAGLPVLVSERCGCAPDLVIPGVTGFTFEPTNPSDLARLMTRVGAADAECCSMGLAARAAIQAFSPDRFADGLWGAALAALAAPRPRPGLFVRLSVGAL